jgi:hypothetical protein
MAEPPKPAIPDGRLLGLSLRHCIDDLIYRRLAVDRVEMILSDTACPDYSAWESAVMLPGTHTWWARDPMGARRFVEQLRAAGRIHQPLLEGGDAPEFEPGHHWIPYPI